MPDTPCSEVVLRVLATHSIRQFPFTSRPVRHRVPSHFNWTLLYFARSPATMTQVIVAFLRLFTLLSWDGYNSLLLKPYLPTIRDHLPPLFNLLAQGFTFKFQHTLYVKCEYRYQKKVALWNKRHFEEKNGECAACLKYSVLIVIKYIYIYIYIYI